MQEKEILVARVEKFQGLNIAHKELWEQYADTYLGGVRDPALHEEAILHEFCENHGAPQADPPPAAEAPTLPSAEAEPRALEPPVKMRKIVGTKSRTGRDQQRWDGETRLICGSVCVQDGLVLVVSSGKHAGQWILPKGGWDNDETDAECAAREAWEEAGVEGNIEGYLGEIQFKDDRRARWFQFKVTRLLDESEWSEKERRRQWLTPEQARSSCARPEFAFALDSYLQGCNRERKPSTSAALESVAALSMGRAYVGSQAVEAEAPRWKILQWDPVNVRRTMDFDAAIVGHKMNGDIVRGLDKDGWIKLAGNEGYIVKANRNSGRPVLERC